MERTKKIELCKHSECTGCGICIDVCDKKCIEFKEDLEGFFYPKINKNQCLECEKCTKVCPTRYRFKKRPIDLHMAWHLDDDVLERSSSGGMFTALSNWVFRHNGVVFGATLDYKTRKVFHTYIMRSEELDKLRLSKYHQSDASGSYKKVKELLSQKRWVLFSGTACQIAALYAYLEKCDQTYLLTMDVLCHGVTSQKVVEAYLKSKEKKYKSNIKQFFFRVKTNDIWWYRGGGQA